MKQEKKGNKTATLSKNGTSSGLIPLLTAPPECLIGLIFILGKIPANLHHMSVKQLKKPLCGNQMLAEGYIMRIQ